MMDQVKHELAKKSWCSIETNLLAGIPNNSKRALKGAIQLSYSLPILSTILFKSMDGMWLQVELKLFSSNRNRTTYRAYR